MSPAVLSALHARLAVAIDLASSALTLRLTHLLLPRLFPLISEF